MAYVKKTWQTGDIVTAADLNNMENGIADVASDEIVAADFSASTTYTIGDYCMYNGVLYKCIRAHTGAWNAADFAQTSVGEELTGLQDIISSVGLKRYGVSGVGLQPSALTRLWDAVGMTAQVGTDGDNSNVVNDFDNAPPFNRRKCVGYWEVNGDHASFRVMAYYGDSNYTEDGTMGDFVAVECPRAYYYKSGNVLGISAHQFEGYRPFDIFCRNHDQNDTIPFVYLPAYALALKDGHAVSLPDLDNEQGAYKTLFDAARTYDGDAATYAILQPAAVMFYERAMQTVEFAQQDIKVTMRGCLSLWSDNADTVVFTDATHVLTNNYHAPRVVGEYICIYGGTANHTNVAYKATHKILSVVRCDESGNASSSGTHQLIEVEDLGKGYFTYELGTTYNLAARPYRTGSCNGVSTPSGSPVSNTDGYHPMKYRWRENTHGNQIKTFVDLFNNRVGTSNSDWTLEWYYLPKPWLYTPSSTSKPDATDLATDAFVKLDLETSHANYANGYIQSRQYSAMYPDVFAPLIVTGASDTTYTATYAYLVSSFVVRSVRFGGYWFSGRVSFYALNAPSYAYAFYGGDLCFYQ